MKHHGRTENGTLMSVVSHLSAMKLRMDGAPSVPWRGYGCATRPFAPTVVRPGPPPAMKHHGRMENGTLKSVVSHPSAMKLRMDGAPSVPWRGYGWGTRRDRKKRTGIAQTEESIINVHLNRRSIPGPKIRTWGTHFSY